LHETDYETFSVDDWMKLDMTKFFKEITNTSKSQKEEEKQVQQQQHEQQQQNEVEVEQPREGEVQQAEGEKSQAERLPRRREPRSEGSGAPLGGEKIERAEKGERPPRVVEGGRGRRENKDREFQGQRPNKRPYDRKSGSGRGKEIKKGGGGRANWGKEGGDDQWEEVPTTEKQEEESKPEAEAKVEPEIASAPIKEETEAEKKFKEEEEKEAKQITLEDYLKKKETEKKGSVIPELPAPRQAGEGVDKKELQKWAQFTPLKREEESEKPLSAESKKDKKKEPKKQAVPVDTVLKVHAPKKPRSGKPEGASPLERRRDFKDSPRGGKRKTGAAAPDVKDASSFPALSTKA